TFVDEKFPNGAPSFANFLKLVKGLAEKNKPKPVVETPAPGETATPGTAAAGGGSAADATISSADDAVIAVQKAAWFLLEQSRSNPVPYRLMRILKWG